MRCLILHAQLVSSNAIRCSEKLMRAADILSCVEVEVADVDRLTSTALQCVQKLCECGMKRDAINLLEKHTDVVSTWCHNWRQSDSLMNVLIQVEYYKLNKR